MSNDHPAPFESREAVHARQKQLVRGSLMLAPGKADRSFEAGVVGLAIAIARVYAGPEEG
jgi:hypothetical protein